MVAYILNTDGGNRRVNRLETVPDRNPQMRHELGVEEISYPGRVLGDPAVTPTIVQTIRGVKELSDVFGPHAVVVSERFRELVETFDPGVHRFRPVQVIDHKGNQWDGRYYLFQVGRRIAAIEVAASGFSWSLCAGGRSHYLSYPYGIPPVVLNARQIGRSQMFCVDPSWRSYDLPIVSSAFFAAFKKSKLRGAAWRKCETVDMSWDPVANLPPPDLPADERN